MLASEASIEAKPNPVVHSGTQTGALIVIDVQRALRVGGGGVPERTNNAVHCARVLRHAIGWL